MQKYFNTILDEKGDPIGTASVLVKTPAGATATIYRDNSGTTTGNPLSTEENGYFEFYAPNGLYNIVASKTGKTTVTTVTIDNILLDDPTVATIAALKAAGVPTTANTKVTVVEAGRAGDFYWVTGDQSANVTADTQSGIWVAPDSAPTGASGAWKRVYSGAISPLWFGMANDSTVTDDSVKINSAFTAAASLGLPIDFVGVDARVNQRLILFSGAELIGNGGRLNFYPSAENTHCFYGADVDNVHIRGLTIEQKNLTANNESILIYISDGAEHSDIRIENNRIISPSRHGVGINGHDSSDGTAPDANPGYKNLFIRFNKIENPGSQGVLLYGNHEHVYVTNNIVIHGSADTSIKIDIFIKYFVVSENIVDGTIVVEGGSQFGCIQGNVASKVALGYGTVTGSLGGAGVPWYACHDISIIGNTVYGTSSLTHGIEAVGHAGHTSGTTPYVYEARPEETAKRIKIIGNTIYSADVIGIQLSRTEDSKIIGNTIHVPVSYGISAFGCNDNDIKDNDISDSPTYGIYVYGDATTSSRRIVVSGNSLKDNTTAKNAEIYLGQYADSCVIGQNIIDPGTTTVSLFAVQIDGATNTELLQPQKIVNAPATGRISIAAASTFKKGGYSASSGIFVLNTASVDVLNYFYRGGAADTPQIIVTDAFLVFTTAATAGTTSTIQLGRPSSFGELVSEATPATAALYSAQTLTILVNGKLTLAANEPLVARITAPGTTDGQAKLIAYYSYV